MQYFVNLVTLIITKNFFLFTGEMEGESDVGLRTMAIDSSASLAQRRLSARMRKEKVKLNRTVIVKICPYRDR